MDKANSRRRDASGASARGSGRPPLLGIGLDRADAAPLQSQLYAQLREAVLRGRLQPGARLPATRTLAQELGCSRNTVLGAFEQLAAEGYLQGSVGAGTFVSRALPEAAPRTPAAPPHRGATAPSGGLSRLALAVTPLMPPRGRRLDAFAPSVPEIGDFPFEIWGRLLAAAWTSPQVGLATHFDARGYRPLREAIADHLKAVRLVECDADQVIITAGAQNALDMTARLLLDPGSRVWIEDPCYPGTRAALVAAGMLVEAIPLDRHGMRIPPPDRVRDPPRLIVVTPSHQYPLGSTMSLRRRLDLLAFAAHHDALILEDDYDSEFRYGGRPLASLQGIDKGGRVVYLGTFSKVMFPALRIAYLVLPTHLAAGFAAARIALDVQPSIVAQPALATFVRDGHLAAHVRRMRVLYARRRDVLLHELRRQARDLVEPEAPETGLHMVVRLPAAADDRAISDQALAAGIAAPALSRYFAAGRDAARGLILGYGAVPDAIMPRCVAELAAIIRSHRPSATGDPRAMDRVMARDG
jgi:GntR family transcriptional regulator/MocR family aminotransferase